MSPRPGTVDGPFGGPFDGRAGGRTVAAVLFDLDGVLAASAASIRRAWQRWAAETGVGWAELSGHVAGRLAVDTVAAVLPGLDRDARQAHADTVNAYQVADPDDDVPVPGMPELVGGIAGCTWAVVTAAPRALAVARLDRCGYPRPPVLVTAEDVARGKPDPEGYLTAAARLGVAPADCLVVEDSPAGVAAGLAAGAAVLAIAAPGSAAAAGAWLAVPDGRGVRMRPAGDGRVRVEPGAGG
jgi:sugar-phosphatase